MKFSEHEEWGHRGEMVAKNTGWGWGSLSLNPDSLASPGKATPCSINHFFLPGIAFLSLSKCLMKEVGCELVPERQAR